MAKAKTNAQKSSVEDTPQPRSRNYLETGYDRGPLDSQLVMPKARVSIQKFKGSTPFPLDMLRYDQAYPVSQRDVQKILETFAVRSPEPVSIEVAVQHAKGFTLSRWQSFGWYAEV